MIELIAAAFGWFVLGWACRGLQLERLGRNSNGNCVPLPPAPPYSSSAIAWEEGRTQRGNGSGGTTTPKPPIKPQFPPPRKIREDFLPHHHESHE
jgi:hypothetical protein